MITRMLQSRFAQAVGVVTEIETLRRNVIRDPFNTFARRLYAERVEEESSDNQATVDQIRAACDAMDLAGAQVVCQAGLLENVLNRSYDVTFNSLTGKTVSAGFVDVLHVTGSHLLATARRRFDADPIRQVVLTDLPGETRVGRARRWWGVDWRDFIPGPIGERIEAGYPVTFDCPIGERIEASYPVTFDSAKDAYATLNVALVAAGRASVPWLLEEAGDLYSPLLWLPELVDPVRRYFGGLVR